MNLDPKSIPTTGKLHRIPSPKENFGLSKAEFQRCVDNLKNGDDSLITNNMVNQLQQSMSYLQSKFSISRNQAYDICMNTLLEFRQKLITGKIGYGNLRFLYTRMCSNQFIDGEKAKKKTNEAIKTFLDTKGDTIRKEDFFEKLECTLLKLRPDQRSLIKELYYSGKTPELIASEQNLSYANLRKKKQRILNRIREIYFKKGNI